MIWRFALGFPLRFRPLHASRRAKQIGQRSFTGCLRVAAIASVERSAMDRLLVFCFISAPAPRRVTSTSQFERDVEQFFRFLIGWNLRTRKRC